MSRSPRLVEAETHIADVRAALEDLREVPCPNAVEISRLTRQHRLLTEYREACLRAQARAAGQPAPRAGA